MTIFESVGVWVVSSILGTLVTIVGALGCAWVWRRWDEWMNGGAR